MCVYAKYGHEVWGPKWYFTEKLIQEPKILKLGLIRFKCLNFKSSIEIACKNIKFVHRVKIQIDKKPQEGWERMKWEMIIAFYALFFCARPFYYTIFSFLKSVLILHLHHIKI